METTIVILKYLGMILSGFFGIFALLVKFKDDSGKVTRAGRIALMLIVLSTSIAVGSQTFDLLRSRKERADAAQRQARETLEAVQRTEKMLFEVNRGLHPLSDIRIGYWISAPIDHAQMKPYVARFRAEVDKLVPRLDSGEDIPGIVGGRMDAGRKYEEFGFDGSSPLAPSRDSEKLAYTVLGHAEVELQFYTSPIQVRDHPELSGRWDKQPDLTMSVSSEFDPRPHEGHSVEYELASHHTTIRGHMIKSDRQYWKSSGRIVGLPDLLGAQMFVVLPSIVISGDPSVDQFLPEIRRRFELETLVFSVSGDQEFWFRGPSLEKHSDKNGFPIYVFTFPKTMEELRKLSR